MVNYTPKQRELMRLWQKNELARINLLEGSVSSGKTWISLVLWAFWVKTMPEDRLYLMCAKSLTTLKRNCLLLLQELVGEKNFTFSIPAKEGRLFGRQVLFEGANDARAESKIRGMTLQGAYCDELTQFPEDFFAMLLSRLRVSGAKLIATTNPDNPSHWLMLRYIKRADELDFLDVKFTIDDNTMLPKDYVENIKREYTGVFYDRFILGRWVVAEGLVYQFDRERHITAETPAKGKGRWFISVDYGTLNPFSAGLWCVADGVATRVREYYYSGREKTALRTDEEYYAELERLAGGAPVEYVVVDPSAASFIETIRRHGRFPVRKARNEVLSGIRLTAALLRAGRLKIHENCKDAIREFGLYCWDERGETDRPLKVNDHAMDDIRYFCSTVMRRLLRGIPEWRGIDDGTETLDM
ncbi:MAG: PBSX family phage terminase large subunit [Oscillospiraceae bacterium]|nr:PBSX family phage terminase large subunit [Oscillospiraceae bacterium]